MRIKLSSRTLGEPHHPWVFVAHGLCGSGRNWLSVGEAIAQAGFCVHLLDLRDHGSSSWSNELSYSAHADDFLAHWQQAGRPPFIFLGHSMGGKLGMALAAKENYQNEFKENFRGLCVVDIVPAERHPPYAPALQACRDLPLHLVRNRKDAGELLKDKIPDETFRLWLLTNLVPEETGGFRWACNFPLIVRDLDKIAANPLSVNDHWSSPVHFIAGERSDYVPRNALPLIQSHFPAAGLSWLPTGHNVHAESPAEFAAAFTRWAQGLPPHP